MTENLFVCPAQPASVRDLHARLFRKREPGFFIALQSLPGVVLLKALLLTTPWLSTTWMILAVILAEIEATGWVLIISAVFLGLTQIIGMIIAWLREKRKEIRDEAVRLQVVDAAKKVKDVKDTLTHSQEVTDEKLDGITKVTTENAKVGVATHTLVNSNMAVQLKLNATMARELANLKKASNDPVWREYEAAAALAEKLSSEHASKQQQVDTQAARDTSEATKETKAPDQKITITGTLSGKVEK